MIHDPLTRRRGVRADTRHWAWRLVLAFVKLMVLLVMVVFLGVLGLYVYYGRDLPDPSEIGRRHPAETTRLYARDGVTLLYELVDQEGGRRTVVPFDRIPQVLKDATVAVEDANFYQNPGVDVRGIVRAFVQNYQAQEVVSGGSTITQQLVRQVLLTSEERYRVSFERKVREAILAFRVSRQYSKEQILSIYLNEVYYGHQAYGVEAAAQVYFGKHVGELSAAEATLIAGLPQSPTTYNPLVNLPGAKARQRVTLDLMVAHGYLRAADAERLFQAPLRFAPQTTSLLAPHFVFYVRDLLEQRYGPDVLYRGGLRVVTSIDLYWQNQVQQIVQARMAALRERHASNAGVVLLSPEDEVLAMVGSVDYNDATIDGNVNVTLAARQPGSALKPVVYAAALQRGWTPATLLWDVPTVFRAAHGSVYEPRNYDDAWHGPQRLRLALANSFNIPAVKALEFVGVENFVEQAHRMGITTLTDPSRYGLSLVLGAGEVRLLDLTNVYSTLRNAGRMRSPVAILKVTNSRGEVLEAAGSVPGHQVLGDHGEQIAYLMTDMLSDNAARWPMFGRGNVMELSDGRPAAVKTGTSNDWRDSWALGYTPDVTVGVWVGNNDGSPMQEVAGVNGAGVIWRDVMDAYHAGRPVQQFVRPPGVVDVPICADTGAPVVGACSTPIREYFVAGNEPRASEITVQAVRVGGDGGCLAATYTPPEQVHEVPFVIYPPQYRGWAIGAGIAQPPTEYCPPPVGRSDAAMALLVEPRANAVLTQTQVLVRGTARGPYTLEVGRGANPSTWQVIVRSPDAVTNGILGVWRTDGFVPDGYTLRLHVSLLPGPAIEVRRTVQFRR